MSESGKSKKHGRNANWCKAYKLSGRREKNKAKRLLKHIDRYGTADHCAVHRFNNLSLLDRPPEAKANITPTRGKRKKAQG